MPGSTAELRENVSTSIRSPFLPLLQDPDTDAMLVGSNILKKDTPAYTVFSVPITPAVQAWKAGEPNYGLLLKVENEAFEGRGLRFYSNTVTDESLHAYITVVCST